MNTICTKVLQQINVKGGGTLWKVELFDFPFMKNPTMVIKLEYCLNNIFLLDLRLGYWSYEGKVRFP
jgi:hypothetical protein